VYTAPLSSLNVVVLPAGQGVGVFIGTTDEEEAVELVVAELVVDALIDEDELVVVVVVKAATTRFAATCELSLGEKALLAAAFR